MLKKILASLALTVGTIHPSIASEPVQVDSKITCASFAVINEALEKYGEIPFVTMTAYRMSRNQKVVEIPAVMFVNPKTKTYTVVEQFNEKVYCVVSMGEEVKPYIK